MDRTLIAAEVRRVRVAASLTQAELARRAGTTQSAVSRMESGRVTPSLAALDRVADAAGRPIILVVGPSFEHPAPLPPAGAPVLPRSVRQGSGRPLPSATRARRG